MAIINIKYSYSNGKSRVKLKKDESHFQNISST